MIFLKYLQYYAAGICTVIRTVYPALLLREYMKCP